MKRTFHLYVLLAALAWAGGCSLCAGPDDYAYSAYGGAWRRDDMCRGRVASAIAPADHSAATAELIAPPTTVEEAPPVDDGDPPPALAPQK
jgi:hypothetical protein